MLRRTVLAVVVILAVPAATLAIIGVQTGIDPVEHLPPSWWDFGPTPLPADYFGPGSDPFDGGVPADASHMGSSPDCPGDLSHTSMLISRNTPASLGYVPTSDVVDVEIIAMHLHSTNPITVTYAGGLNPELWEVEISLSASLPSTGTMTIRREYENGGTFDSAILVQPYFTFRRISDGYELTLDGAVTYEDMVTATAVPWEFDAPGLTCPSCVSNFRPGYDGVDPVDYALTGTRSFHTVRTGCVVAPTAVPTLSEWGMIAALTILLFSGALFITRRRRLSTGPVD